MNQQNVHHIGKDEKEKRPAFRKTLETQEVYKRLTEAKPGDVVTYLELSEIVGKNIQKEGYGHLYSAVKMIRRNENKVFQAVENVGVKYCSYYEAFQAGKAGNRRIRNIIKMNKEKMLCAEPGINEMSSQQRIEYYTELSHTGALECFVKPKTISTIEQKVMMTGKLITYEDTLDLFTR